MTEGADCGGGVNGIPVSDELDDLDELDELDKLDDWFRPRKIRAPLVQLVRRTAPTCDLRTVDAILGRYAGRYRPQGRYRLNPRSIPPPRLGPCVFALKVWEHPTSRRSPCDGVPNTNTKHQTPNRCFPQHRSAVQRCISASSGCPAARRRIAFLVATRFPACVAIVHRTGANLRHPLCFPSSGPHFTARRAPGLVPRPSALVSFIPAHVPSHANSRVSRTGGPASPPSADAPLDRVRRRNGRIESYWTSSKCRFDRWGERSNTYATATAGVRAVAARCEVSSKRSRQRSPHASLDAVVAAFDHVANRKTTTSSPERLYRPHGMRIGLKLLCEGTSLPGATRST